MQPISAGPGTSTYYKHEMPKSAQHFSRLGTIKANVHILCLIRLSAKTRPIGFTVHNVTNQVFLKCSVFFVWLSRNPIYFRQDIFKLLIKNKYKNNVIYF
jgi:hypothetical protein